MLLNIFVESLKEFVDERFQIRSKLFPLAVKVDKDVAVEKPSSGKRMQRTSAKLYIFKILVAF